MLLEIPRLPFASKEEEHASQAKIDLATIDGRNRGRLAPLTTTFTLMRSSDSSKVLLELNCSHPNAVASTGLQQTRERGSSDPTVIRSSPELIDFAGHER